MHRKLWNMNMKILLINVNVMEMPTTVQNDDFFFFFFVVRLDHK